MIGSYCVLFNIWCVNRDNPQMGERAASITFTFIPSLSLFLSRSRAVQLLQHKFNLNHYRFLSSPLGPIL